MHYDAETFHSVLAGFQMVWYSSRTMKTCELLCMLGDLQKLNHFNTNKSINVNFGVISFTYVASQWGIGRLWSLP